MTIQQNKIITIFGGTGSQGGSVARSLLAHKDGRFHVRVITRDPSSDRAKAIAADGASLVQADGFNREQMVAALAGSWGVFINTNSDDEVSLSRTRSGPFAFHALTRQALKSLDGPSDYDLGAAVIDAAEEAGVPHVVYSSGPSITNATKGRIHLEGFESTAPPLA